MPTDSLWWLLNYFIRKYHLILWNRCSSSFRRGGIIKCEYFLYCPTFIMDVSFQRSAGGWRRPVKAKLLLYVTWHFSSFHLIFIASIISIKTGPFFFCVAWVVSSVCCVSPGLLQSAWSCHGGSAVFSFSPPLTHSACCSVLSKKLLCSSHESRHWWVKCFLHAS